MTAPAPHPPDPGTSHPDAADPGATRSGSPDASAARSGVPDLATVVAVTATPFDAAGRVDEAAYARLVARLLDGGITAVTPNGNTGEFHSLSVTEADRIAGETLQRFGDRATVVPGVGHAPEVAAAMTRHAVAAGAPAVMVHQPVHAYQSRAGWLDYHRVVADAAGDAGIVVYLRDRRITGHLLADLAAACPNLVAVKYAVPDPVAFADAVTALGPDRLTWLCGLAESWAPFLWPAGATGFTSGLANVAPHISLALLAALRAGDAAETMRYWRLVRPFEQLRARDGSADNVTVVKTALADQGVCRADVRPPSSPLPATDRTRVIEILSTLTD